MPRRNKGAHLLLRKERRICNGELNHYAVWLIRDRDHEESTGCGVDNRTGAERALEGYLNRKHTAVASAGIRAPAFIPVADVIALYAQDKAPHHSRPKETAFRLKSLLAF